MKLRDSWNVAPCSRSWPRFQRCVLPPSWDAPLKRRSTSTWLHGAAFQKTLNFFPYFLLCVNVSRPFVAVGTLLPRSYVNMHSSPFLDLDALGYNLRGLELPVLATHGALTQDHGRLGVESTSRGCKPLGTPRFLPKGLPKIGPATMRSPRQHWTSLSLLEHVATMVSEVFAHHTLSQQWLFAFVIPFIWEWHSSAVTLSRGYQQINLSTALPSCGGVNSTFGISVYSKEYIIYVTNLIFIS
jgi:hypothetical protein